jgi:hypothetical protein
MKKLFFYLLSILIFTLLTFSVIQLCKIEELNEEHIESKVNIT